MNFQLISAPAELPAAVSHLSQAGPLAVDMEMENNLHHYGLHLALVQVATPANVIYIFDPVALVDLRPLCGLFTNARRELIMHGADFDRRTCFQLHGWVLNPIFDTQIAAMFCGYKQTSLANLLHQLFGVKTDKRFQRHDWLKRPLTRPALEYAAWDVNRLHALREHFIGQLAELKRLAWAREEMVFASRSLADDRPTPAHCRVKHSAGLAPRQLAVLKSLCDYREQIARRLDRPVHFIIRDLLLIEIVKHPPRDEKAVLAIKGLHPALYRRPGADGLLEAIRTGMKAPEEVRQVWHGRRMPPARGWEERLKSMRAWRFDFSRQLNLEPHLIFDGNVMSWCARHPGQELLPVIAGQIRNWQQELLWPEFQKRFKVG